MSTFAARVARATGSLLDAAQAYWFERFLQAAPADAHELPFELPFEVYVWALPGNAADGYPNLSTCTWPA